jgi:hypothetical protein
MAMALEQEDELLLKTVFQSLKEEPLKTGDPRYVPIYSCEGAEDPIAKLQTHIEWTTVESVQLFSGYRGTGKTTELFRLRTQLEEKGYLVVYANALEYISPADPIDIATLLRSRLQIT